VENNVKRVKRKLSLEFKKEASELAKKLGNSEAARSLCFPENPTRAAF
jgi:hypothetical protein